MHIIINGVGVEDIKSGQVLLILLSWNSQVKHHQVLLLVYCHHLVRHTFLARTTAITFSLHFCRQPVPVLGLPDRRDCCHHQIQYLLMPSLNVTNIRFLNCCQCISSSNLGYTSVLVWFQTRFFFLGHTMHNQVHIVALFLMHL